MYLTALTLIAGPISLRSAPGIFCPTLNQNLCGFMIPLDNIAEQAVRCQTTLIHVSRHVLFYAILK